MHSLTLRSCPGATTVPDSWFQLSGMYFHKFPSMFYYTLLNGLLTIDVPPLQLSLHLLPELELFSWKIKLNMSLLPLNTSYRFPGLRNGRSSPSSWACKCTRHESLHTDGLTESSWPLCETGTGYSHFSDEDAGAQRWCVMRSRSHEVHPFQLDYGALSMSLSSISWHPSSFLFLCLCACDLACCDSIIVPSSFIKTLSPNHFLKTPQNSKLLRQSWPLPPLWWF